MDLQDCLWLICVVCKDAPRKRPSKNPPAGRAIHKKITRAFRKESPGSMVAAKTNYLTNNFVAAKEPPWVALMK